MVETITIDVAIEGLVERTMELCEAEFAMLKDPLNEGAKIRVELAKVKLKEGITWLMIICELRARGI